MKFLYVNDAPPDDERPLWQVNATVAHLDQTIQQARTAARTWAQRPFAARLRSLQGAGHFLGSRRNEVLSWSQWDQVFQTDKQSVQRLTQAIDALTHPQLSPLHCPSTPDDDIHSGMVARIALVDRAQSLDVLMNWSIPIMAAGHSVVGVLTYEQLCRLPLAVLAVSAVLRGWLPPGVFELLCTNDPTVTHRLVRDPRLTTISLVPHAVESAKPLRPQRYPEDPMRVLH